MGIKTAVEEVEARALELSVADRASLVGVIVKSLVPDHGIMNAWMDEAERRDREMGEDPNAGRPAGEVLQRIRASLP